MTLSIIHRVIGASLAHHAGVTWTHYPKRVFAIDIEKCEKCGGPVRTRLRMLSKANMFFWFRPMTGAVVRCLSHALDDLEKLLSGG